MPTENKSFLRPPKSLLVIPASTVKYVQSISTPLNTGRDFARACWGLRLTGREEHKLTEPFRQTLNGKGRACCFIVESSQEAPWVRSFSDAWFSPPCSFSRIFSLLHFNNNESMFLKQAFSLEFVGCSCWAAHKPACTARPVATPGECAVLILFPAKPGPDNCHVN